MSALPKRIEEAMDAYSAEEQKLGEEGVAKTARAYPAKLWLEAEIRLGMTVAAVAALPSWLNAKGARRLAAMYQADLAAADEARATYLRPPSSAAADAGGATPTPKKEG